MQHKYNRNIKSNKQNRTNVANTCKNNIEMKKRKYDIL